MIPQGQDLMEFAHTVGGRIVNGHFILHGKVEDRITFRSGNLEETMSYPELVWGHFGDLT